jgi:hypothetical protein
MRISWLSIFGLFSIAVTGCGASQANAGNNLPTAPSNPMSTNIAAPPLSTTPKQWDDMPVDPPLSFSTNADLPALIDRTKTDLAERLAIPKSQIKTIEAKEAVWPDASLGCPQAGTAYAQIPTQGYMVMLDHAGSKYEYHVDIRGNAFYCRNPPNSGTPIEITPFPSAPP